MIKRSDIFPAGVFNKPHGVNGEISASFDEGVDPTATDCVIVDIDGIFVPFFITGIRPKGRDSFLLKIDGIDNEVQAKLLVNRQIFMRQSEKQQIIAVDEDADDQDGLYAADLVGYTMLLTDGSIIGKIVDIDDSTANVLFVVEKTEGDGTFLVPVADEFITDIDTDNSTLTVDLPEGLINN